MRRSMVMVFLVPALVVLASAPAPASAASTASTASSPAAKRVAKRGSSRPPVVLPAPPVTSLPPLPATAYDKSQTTTLTSAVVTTPGAGDVSTAGGEALPSLPASSAPAAPSVYTPKESGPDSPHDWTVAPKGWVIQAGIGLLVPATPFVAGGDPVGPGASFDVRLGVYVTPHLGILGGFRGASGHKRGGCGDGCGGYSLQAPLVVQLAARDRNHGLYGELGFGFGTTYASYGGGVSVSVSAPVVLKSGLGYRFDHPGSSITGDINLGTDIGTMKRVSVDTGSSELTAAMGDAPVSVVVGLSVLTHFSL